MDTVVTISVYTKRLLTDRDLCGVNQGIWRAQSWVANSIRIFFSAY